jgi:cytochrome c-type biogenesis protein CcmH/NrfG
MAAPRSLAVLALALGACSSADFGVRRMAEPQKASVALARAAEGRGDWGQAASIWYELYLLGGDGAATALAQTAMALCDAGAPASAQRLLERELETRPDQIEVLEGLAAVMLRSGFRRAAEPHLERVLELDPDRISTLLLLARLRFELGLEVGCIPLLERRIALGGGDAETWVMLARARREAGEFPSAVDAYRRAVELGESDPGRLLFAASLYFEVEAEQRGALDTALAEAWIQRAIEVDPERTDAHFLLGVLREGEQRDDEALACYLRALELDPAERKILRRAAELHARRGERDGALALGLRFVNSAPQRSDERAAAERWLTSLEERLAPVRRDESLR